MNKKWRKKVEVLKIGTIIPYTLSKEEIHHAGLKDIKEKILVVSDGGPQFDFYVSVIKEKCSNDYKFQKTAQDIVGTPTRYIVSSVGYKKVDRIKGYQLNYPRVGFSYCVDNWATSTVVKIVDENIFITKNSVYAIHDMSIIRDKKLNDLGI